MLNKCLSASSAEALERCYAMASRTSAMSRFLGHPCSEFICATVNCRGSVSPSSSSRGLPLLPPAVESSEDPQQAPPSSATTGAILCGLVLRGLARAQHNAGMAPLLFC